MSWRKRDLLVADIQQDVHAIRHARTHAAVDSIVRAMKALGRFNEAVREIAHESHRRLYARGEFR